MDRISSGQNIFREMLAILSIPPDLLSRACMYLFFILVLTMPAAAQIISGIVTDQQSAPVAGAAVSISSQNKIVAQTVTDMEGRFTLAAAGDAPLILKASARGFAPHEKQLSAADLAAEQRVTLAALNVREEVTVSITQTETRLSETAASVVVIGRETLDVTAAPAVDDALRQIAGFNLFRRSSSRTTNPTAQGANFRGLAGSGASRASVLLDGVPLNDAFGGWTYWTRVPRAALEQIETLRGGASSLYGDAALSGAINLQTASPDDRPVLNLETSGGTQGTYQVSAFGAYGRSGWSVAGSFDAFRTGGYIPVAEEERGAVDSEANSRYENGFLTLEKRWSAARAGGLPALSRIFLRGNLFSEKRDNGTRLTANRTYFRQAIFGADLGSETAGTFRIRSFVDKQIYDQTFSAVAANRNSENLTRLQRVPSQSAGGSLSWSRLFAAHLVSGALEIREVRGASDEIGFVNNRAASLVGAGGRERTFSLSVQDFWRAGDRLNVTFGARFDGWRNARAHSTTRNLSTDRTAVTVFPDRDESALSPRLSALYRVSRNFSVYGAFSRSFRAPTLNELYRAFRVGNILTLANENLRAERATNFETGVNFSAFSRRLAGRANFFTAGVSRPIVNVTVATAPNLITRQRQNVGRTRARGLELDADLLVRKDLRLAASYLLVDSRVDHFPTNPGLVGKFLPQVPRQQFNFQMFYRPPGRFSAGLQGRLSDFQFEDDLNTLRLRPFFTLDALGAYKINRSIEILVAVENIFNSRYDIGLTPTRTVAAPRFARIGLRLSW